MPSAEVSIEEPPFARCPLPNRFADERAYFLRYAARQAVENVSVIAPRDDEALILEDPEMPRHVRLAEIRRVHELGDAFFAVAEAVQNREPRRIRHRLEPPCDQFEGYRLC